MRRRSFLKFLGLSSFAALGAVELYKLVEDKPRTTVEFFAEGDLPIEVLENAKRTFDEEMKESGYIEVEPQCYARIKPHVFKGLADRNDWYLGGA